MDAEDTEDTEGVFLFREQLCLIISLNLNFH